MALAFAVGCGPQETPPTDPTDTTDTTDTEDLSGCVAGVDPPELFLGKGVGGAFELLETDAQVGLTVAPQGGMGVSVLIGSRGLQAGPYEAVTATLVGDTTAVEGARAEFALNATLQCKSDGPDGSQGVIYGVVVGFASSLGNTDLLAMNGQGATLDVTVTDALGNTASVVHPVVLIVGE